MERAEWLKQMRSKAEGLYDLGSPKYWVTWGFYENEKQLIFLRKLLEQIVPGGAILSAGCGAGRYDGLLVEAGHSVLGIDQSAGMLARARGHFPVERFPQLRYEKIGLQEMDFDQAFDGVICIDALEHICPEDVPGILRGFQEALKPGGVVYFNLDEREASELKAAYTRAKEKGLPVVYGEVADRVDELYDLMKSGIEVPDDELDYAVYHFCPSREQARAWIDQAGLTIEEEDVSSGYHHYLAKKK